MFVELKFSLYISVTFADLCRGWPGFLVIVYERWCTMLPPNVTWFDLCIVHAAKMLCEQLCWSSLKMSRTRSTALERSVITLLGEGEILNRFYGIPTLALGPGTVHKCCLRWCAVISINGLNHFLTLDVVQVVSESIHVYTFSYLI